MIAGLETVLTQRPPFTNHGRRTLTPIGTLFPAFLDLPGHLFVDGVRFLVTLSLLLLGHGTSACPSG